MQAIRALEPDPNAELSATGLDACRHILSEFSDWTGDFWAALNQADQDLGPTKEHALTLLNTIAAFGKLERLRPWRGLFDSIDRMLASLRGVLDCSLVAYSAPTPIEAQEAQRRMQKHLDAAADAVSGWGFALHQFGELIGEAPEDQLIIAAAAGFHADSESLSLSERLLHDLGFSSRPFPGVTEFITVCVELCAILGEYRPFVDTVSKVVQVLRVERDKGRATIGSPQFQENFARALSETYRSGALLHILAVVNGNENLAVDAMVDTAHSLVESSTRHTLALVASVLGPAGYKRNLELGANDCIRMLTNAGYPELVSGLSLDLRNAKSHRTYRLTEDGGLDVLTERGNVKVHLDIAHIADTIVAGHVLAMGLTVGVALFACDVDIDVTALVEGVDSFPTVQMVQYIALMNGWGRPNVEISNDSDTATIGDCPAIAVSANEVELKNLVTALTIARRLPDHVVHAHFDDGNRHPLVIKIARAKEFGDSAEPFETAISCIRLMHSLRRGSERAMSDSDLATLLQANAVRAAGDLDVNALRRLRRLRDLAIECAVVDVANQLADLIQNIRRRLTGGLSAQPSAASFLNIPLLDRQVWGA